MARKRTDADAPGCRTPNGSIIYGPSTGILIDAERFPINAQRCGTRTGFKAHTRRGHEPCEACRQAESGTFANRSRRMRQF